MNMPNDYNSSVSLFCLLLFGSSNFKITRSQGIFGVFGNNTAKLLSTRIFLQKAIDEKKSYTNMDWKVVVRPLCSHRPTHYRHHHTEMKDKKN